MKQLNSLKMLKTKTLIKKFYSNCTIKPRFLTTSPAHDQRIAQMTFASVYPHYVKKIRKTTNKKKLHTLIEWLTGYDERALSELIKQKVTFEKFF